jgi:hypothetical protein
MDPANAVQLNMTGAVTATAEMTRVDDTLYRYHFPVPKAEGEVTVGLGNGADLWGNEVVAVPVIGGSFQIVKFTAGDVDDDGLILAYDAALTLQHSVGLDPLPDIDPLPWDNWRDSTANVDGIGGITAYDAALILQHSAGIITEFPARGKKSLAVADVTAEVEGSELVFYAHGELLGFNLFARDAHARLGVPVFLAEGEERQGEDGFLSALHITQTTYNIGYCSAVSPSDGAPFLRIPMKQSGELLMRMMVNGAEKGLAVHLPVGMIESVGEGLKVYPNPARDQLFVEAGGLAENDGCRVQIVNQLGQNVLEMPVNKPLTRVELPYRVAGMYFLQLTDRKGGVLATEKVVVE